jgi:ERCC4-type nuclease
MNINTNMHLLTADSTDDNLFTMLHMDNNEQQQHNTPYDDIERIITDINILCIDKHVTLIIGFTHNELAQDIHAISIVTNSNNNNKVKQHKHKRYEIGNDDVINTLTCIDNINKTDANNLLLNFKDIVTLCKANESTLSLLPKLSDNKVKMVYSFFNTALN